MERTRGAGGLWSPHATSSRSCEKMSLWCGYCSKMWVSILNWILQPEYLPTSKILGLHKPELPALQPQKNWDSMLPNILLLVRFITAAWNLELENEGICRSVTPRMMARMVGIWFKNAGRHQFHRWDFDFASPGDLTPSGWWFRLLDFTKNKPWSHVTSSQI